MLIYWDTALVKKIAFASSPQNWLPTQRDFWINSIFGMATELLTSGAGRKGFSICFPSG
jgi:hypothetical protein